MINHEKNGNHDMHDGVNFRRWTQLVMVFTV